MHAASSVTVEHVRLRGAQIDAPAARQRLSYLLSSVTLRPSRMSPSAVLVVRSMRDPLPGAIAKPFASAAVPSPAWERAAQARLSALCAEAARPARSVVRPSAEAVLFADQSELLACLALDLGTGAGLAWWWKSILRRHLARGFGAPSDMWPMVWAEQPQYVPGAMQQLDERKQAARVLERIAPTQAWRLLLAVAHAFGLPASMLIAAHDEAGLAPATRNESRRSPSSPAEVPSDAPPEIGTPPAPRQSSAPPRPAHRAPSGRRPDITAPWEPYVAASAVPASLGVERRALLGVSLLLHRAPRQTASAHFAPRFRSWLSGERALAGGHDEERAASSPQSARSGPRVDPVTVNGADARISSSGLQARAPPSPVTVNGADAKIVSSRMQAQASQSPRLDEESTARNRAGSGASARAGLAIGAQPDSMVSASDSVASGLPIQDQIEAAPLPPNIEAAPLAPKRMNFTEAQVQFEDGCPTSLGGIFYLVHLLLRSDLLSFDVGLRGWALLELLARCLLSRAWGAVAEDPVWDALALLDFREPGTHPGADFTPQPVYEAPESWLRGLNESKRYARFRSERVEVWHGEGFLTLDTTAPIHTATCARMSRQQRRAFRKDASVCAAGVDLAPELRRFLHFLLPFVRWRLRRALGEASLADILQRQGTLYITRSHVDLVMRMNEISVPARIAGLDANPGWTPELGRVIKFHFVDEFDGGRL